ncbi:hypothetical protein [Erythrobacter litoralis]|uniref:DUF11 domain-containing protein n=1 Tax=Erythrobacter litoralis (strain HTCC2594) TaxID=314225 RepID=Q2NAG4_ERYLH|nr:hypothetical protein [Erythrobacter litoralis]ABC63327.1 hypothetical protein ELI_06175 [Erythrobacter litoralis HTCC2594]
MNRIKRLVAGTSAIALISVPTIVMAAPVGTAANTDITNTVTVNYQVGGVSQAQVQATDTFKVDRKVNVTVATLDSQAVAVTPGQTSAVTKFSVTNNSNATLDFTLVGSNQNGGASNFNGAINDTFDPTNLRVFIDTNNNGVYDPGTDVQSTTIAGLASGDRVNVFILSDIVLSGGGFPADNAVATVMLTATAASGATAGTAITGVTGASAGSGGTAVTQDATNTKNGMETVFSDASYLTFDAQFNGKHAARSDYAVTAARLAVNKYSRVVQGPAGQTGTLFALPGAVVEYCIVVANGSGGSTATTVAVSDVVPATMTYVANSVYLNGAFNGTNGCAATGGTAGSDGANYNAGTTTVSNTFASIAASETRTLRFQATIR